ncbi:imm11 family protein [Chryseobacterium balustinum]|uniref:imm11 family protein n=1 Tax=Chryseobacterium balustinum TaxID=246 RepID=UPI003CECB73C
MKHYILQHDWKFRLLESEKPFEPYTYESLNHGKKLDNFPKVTLKFQSKDIPDCIPNINGYLVFNQNIISILKENNIDFIQYFDVDMINTDDEVISNNYKCLNILKIIDAIDFENSILKWSDLEGGEIEEDRFIMDVLDLKLRHEKIKNELLFRLKGCENLLVFREDLAQEIVNKRCTGLEFYNAEAYSS